jgi:hypothetical protein
VLIFLSDRVEHIRHYLELKGQVMLTNHLQIVPPGHTSAKYNIITLSVRIVDVIYGPNAEFELLVTSSSIDRTLSGARVGRVMLTNRSRMDAREYAGTNRVKL